MSVKDCRAKLYRYWAKKMPDRELLAFLEHVDQCDYCQQNRSENAGNRSRSILAPAPKAATKNGRSTPLTEFKISDVPTILEDLAAKVNRRMDSIGTEYEAGKRVQRGLKAALRAMGKESAAGKRSTAKPKLPAGVTVTNIQDCLEQGDLKPGELAACLGTGSAQALGKYLSSVDWAKRNGDGTYSLVETSE